MRPAQSSPAVARSGAGIAFVISGCGEVAILAVGGKGCVSSSNGLKKKWREEARGLRFMRDADNLGWRVLAN